MCNSNKRWRKALNIQNLWIKWWGVGQNPGHLDRHWQMLGVIEIYHQVSAANWTTWGYLCHPPVKRGKNWKLALAVRSAIRCAKRLRCRGTSKIWPNQARISLHTPWSDCKPQKCLRVQSKQAISMTIQCRIKFWFFYDWPYLIQLYQLSFLTEFDWFWQCASLERQKTSLFLPIFCLLSQIGK